MIPYHQKFYAKMLFLCSFASCNVYHNANTHQSLGISFLSFLWQKILGSYIINFITKYSWKLYFFQGKLSCKHALIIRHIIFMAKDHWKLYYHFYGKRFLETIFLLWKIVLFNVLYNCCFFLLIGICSDIYKIILHSQTFLAIFFW